MNRIKERRLALGLSQKALAEAVGVNRSTVQQWEHDRNVPTALSREKLCRALQCGPVELGLVPDEPHTREGESGVAPRVDENREKAREYVAQRLALGLTQAQLAQNAGVGVMTIRRLESGRCRPLWETRQKIRLALAMPEERYRSPEERNALFLEMRDVVDTTVGMNMWKIRKAHMDPEDAWQELALHALRAIDRFHDEDMEHLRLYVWCDVKLRLPGILKREQWHGLSGQHSNQPPQFTVFSLDSMTDAGFQFDERGGCSQCDEV